MKKLLIVCLSLLLVGMFSVSAFAADEEIYVYDFGSVTVIFDENDTWDAETREIIAQRLAEGETGESAAPYNLLCTLFGHKYETKSVTTVTHCVQAEQPRCLEEIFDMSLCSRCGDQQVTRVAYAYITCCP